MILKEKNLQEEYSLRFADTENYRTQVWKILCNDYFSRYVSADHTVLDVGCGWGEFINNINAGHKYAMDLNPDVISRLSSTIHFLHHDCSQEWDIPEKSLDIVFSSNFLEHLPDKTYIERVITEAHRCLRAGGLAIFLGPNIKYVKGAYWDFWDHFVPLTEQSLAEILRMKGFQIQDNFPQFLPYSMSMGKTPPVVFLKIYLRFSFLWKFFGKQFLVIAKKTDVRTIRE